MQYLSLLLLLASASLGVQGQHTFTLAPQPGLTSEGILWSANMYWRLTFSNRCGPIVYGQQGEIGWRLGDDTPIVGNVTFWSGFVPNNNDWGLNLNLVADQYWAPGIFLARGTFLQRGGPNELQSPQCGAVNAVGSFTRWHFRGAYALAISNNGVLLRKTAGNVWAEIRDHLGFLFLSSAVGQPQVGLNWRGPDWIVTGNGPDVTSPALAANLPPPTCAAPVVTSVLVDSVINQFTENMTYTRSLALSKSQSSQVSDTFSNSLTISVGISVNVGSDMAGSVTVSANAALNTARSTTYSYSKDFTRAQVTTLEVEVLAGKTLKIYNDATSVACTYQSSIAWTYCHNLFANTCYFIPLQMPLTVVSRTSSLRFAN